MNAPTDIQTVNRTQVAALNLSIRYKLIKILTFGNNGTSGTWKVRSWLSVGNNQVHTVQKAILLDNIVENAALMGVSVIRTKAKIKLAKADVMVKTLATEAETLDAALVLEDQGHNKIFRNVSV